MKSLKIFFLSTICLAMTLAAPAQDKTEKFKVSGNCGMCKKKIETAAKNAGASSASWNIETGELSVSYNSTSANAAKIQQAIAATGYDTPQFRATDDAYSKLHECCRYERAAAAAKGDCCAAGKCVKCEASCCADGKCTASGACCKEGKCEHKESTAGHEAKAGASCCKKS